MSKSTPRLWLKVLLPPAVVIGAILITAVLVKTKPEADLKEPVPILPKIAVYTVVPETDSVVIESQGSVRARRSTRLTARVSGHIEWVSPSFYDGGNFIEGDLLLRLDPLPYESALAEARSRLALAEATLLQEEEAAEQAQLDWKAIGTGEPSPLVLRIPQLMKAKADREAAEVAVEMARRNLDYTGIKAPYDGRVDAKYVDVGQAITAQVTILGDIHAVDSLEIPIPLSLDELAQVDLPAGSEPEASSAKPMARISARIAGEWHGWDGYLDRTAASVNPQSRMITVIARTDAPFGSNEGVVLKPGMFVKVEVEGKAFVDAVRIPRAALKPGNIVYRLTAEDRLESIEVKILHADAESVVVSQGLASGDRLCLTPLLFFVEGMQVQVAATAADGERQT